MIKVSQQICEVAVLEIYARRQFALGQGLTMPELKKAWRETGLRNGDLVDGLLGLIESKQLTRAKQPLEQAANAEALIALTSRGHEMIASGKFREGTLGDYLRLKREVEEARNRRRNAPTTRSRRRVVDSAPPE